MKKTLLFILMVISIAPAFALRILEQPENDTVNFICNTPVTAYFELIADDGADSYQWQVDDGTGFVDLSGETNDWLEVNVQDLNKDGNYYRCIVTSACSDTLKDTSFVAELIIIEEYQPYDFKFYWTDDTLEYNSCTDWNSFYISGSASEGATTMQWQVDSLDGNGFVDIDGETYEYYSNYMSSSTALASEGYKYRLITFGGCNNELSDTSEVITLRTLFTGDATLGNDWNLTQYSNQGKSSYIQIDTNSCSTGGSFNLYTDIIKTCDFDENASDFTYQWYASPYWHDTWEVIDYNWYSSTNDNYSVYWSNNYFPFYMTDGTTPFMDSITHFLCVAEHVGGKIDSIEFIVEVNTGDYTLIEITEPYSWNLNEEDFLVFETDTLSCTEDFPYNFTFNMPSITVSDGTNTYNVTPNYTAEFDVPYLLDSEYNYTTIDTSSNQLNISSLSYDSLKYSWHNNRGFDLTIKITGIDGFCPYEKNLYYYDITYVSLGESAPEITDAFDSIYTLCQGDTWHAPIYGDYWDADSLRWQVNDGNSFVDLYDGSDYSDVTTNSMNGTAASSMDGNTYRCKIYYNNKCGDNFIYSGTYTVNVSSKETADLYITQSSSRCMDNSTNLYANPSNLSSYAWYVDSTGWGYELITDNWMFSGSNTDQLTISDLKYYYNQWKFKCITDTSLYCNPESEEQGLTVYSNRITTGIEEGDNDYSLNFKAYPNPTKDLVKIEFDTNNEERIVRVINILGDEVLSTSTSNKYLSLDFSEFTSGIYTILVKSNNHTGTKKVIKQ